MSHRKARPMTPQPRITGTTPRRAPNSATPAASAIKADIQSTAAATPAGQNTWTAKYTARLSITPTTAAVIAVSGPVNNRLPRVASTSGAPAKMNMNDGRNVKNVTTNAPATPASAGDPAIAAWVQPPTKPTKVTTMIRGPGVVSPSASPSII